MMVPRSDGMHSAPRSLRTHPWGTYATSQNLVDLELRQNIVQCIKTLHDAFPVDLYCPAVHRVMASLHLGKTVSKVCGHYTCCVEVPERYGVLPAELRKRSRRRWPRCKVVRMVSIRR